MLLFVRRADRDVSRGGLPGCRPSTAPVGWGWVCAATLVVGTRRSYARPTSSVNRTRNPSTPTRWPEGARLHSRRFPALAFPFVRKALAPENGGIGALGSCRGRRLSGVRAWLRRVDDVGAVGG